jgi:hypothetical protein
MTTQNTYKMLKERQKMHIKAYLVLCLIIIASMGFYTYKNFVEYSNFKVAVEGNKGLTDVLSDTVSNEKSAYESKKEDFNELSNEIEDKLSYIFPASDEYTALTRQIDAYEDKLTSIKNPFEVSSIDFQEIQNTDKYSILPFSMSIKSSPENFTKFLHLIENSGSLTDQVRLMDISSIRLNFQESEDKTSNVINFNVQINSYFQKQGGSN